jgi:glycosyltransferase involved in cell wall biosynthesis
MHICLIYPGYPPESHAGGIGTFIEELVSTLSHNGNHVIDIISRSDNFGDHVKKLSGKITLYRLGENINAKDDANLLFRKHGYLQYYKKIADLVKTIDSKNVIDIIEVADWGAEGINLFPEFADRVIVRCHTPSFISEKYNPSNAQYLSDGIKKAERKMLSLTKYLACPSKSLFDEISKQVSLNCVFDIEPYPINTRKIITKKTYDLRQPIQLLSVGRIEERKGQDIILQACQQLALKKTATALNLVGVDTPTKNSTPISENFIGKLNGPLQYELNLSGEKPRNQVLREYHNYDIYIAASRFDNYPITLLEAMAAGLPVIGNNNSGIKEIMKENITGLLFNGSSEQLETCISRLLNNATERRQLGLAAKKFVRETLTPKTIYNIIINNYLRICDQKTVLKGKV